MYTRRDFILHEVFDNLHTRKVSSLKPSASDWLTLSISQNILSCICSQQTINGFVYVHEGFIIDVQCASILEGYIQESHPHESLYFKLSNNLLKLRAKEINYASVYWRMWRLLVMLRLCYSAQIGKAHTGTVRNVGVPKEKMKFNALINIRSWYMRDISSRIKHCNKIFFSKLMPSKPLIYLASKTISNGGSLHWGS